MVLDPPSAPTTHVGYLLVPGVALMSFSAAVEPLRAANRLTGLPLYAWHFLTADGQPVRTSAGLEVMPETAIAEAPPLDLALVCAGSGAQRYEDRAVLGWLRRIARMGTAVGSISLGSFILARAGLLDGHRCTIHWEGLAAFREAYPDLDVTEELYEIDRDRLTCSGGTAAMDLMLAIVTAHHGRELATQVAEQFIHERIRDTRDPQRMTLRSRLGVSHPKLIAIVEMMEENLEDPLSRGELARRADLSTRQLERLFRKYLGRTPTRYYLEVRLERARQLLAQTSLSVLDVALACGFVSASHFSKCYRECFHKTPREERSLAG